MYSLTLTKVLLGAKILLTLAIAISIIPLKSKFFEGASSHGDGDGDGDFEFVSIPGAHGPESFAFDGAGEGPYTGVSDGRILKWQPNQRLWTDFAVTSSNRSDCGGPHDHRLTEHICGRPLGLKFNKATGDLYIADAYMGLLRVGPEGGLATPVATEAKGVPFAFANGIDIDEESGAVYFTDTSTLHQRRNYLSVIITADKSGRLMRYDPRTNQVDVVLDNLMFPNGVALSGNGDFVLVAETTTARIIRYWLRTSKAGTSEVFTKDLPGFPDNVKRSPRGGFWVGLHSKRSRTLEWILSNPIFTKIVASLPIDTIMKLYTKVVKKRARGGMVRLGEEGGSVVDVLEDDSGLKWNSVSEADERDGYLWIGSIHKPYAGKLKLRI